MDLMFDSVSERLLKQLKTNKKRFSTYEARIKDVWKEQKGITSFEIKKPSRDGNKSTRLSHANFQRLSQRRC